MPTLFTRIINGEIPANKIAEDERFLAFLDIFPLAEGHTLVVPKIEVDYLFDLDDEQLARMISFSKGVAKAIGHAIPCQKVGVAVIGLEVPHAHIHLVPLNTVSDLNFERPKLKFTPEELSATAAKIRSFMSA